MYFPAESLSFSHNPCVPFHFHLYLSQPSRTCYPASMIILDQTMLQTFAFGEEPIDHFYCLVDRIIRPDGIDLFSLLLTDPRNIDQQILEPDCLLMFKGDEIGSLIARGYLDRDNLHESMFHLAKKEGVL